MREWKLDVSSLYPDFPAEEGYDYAVLVDEIQTGTFACESYGAAITDRSTGERAAVANITVSLPRIDALMELLVRNRVSPVHLRDVVDDWL